MSFHLFASISSMEKRRYAQTSATFDTLDAFLRSTSTLALKETYIGMILNKQIIGKYVSFMFGY